MKTIMHFISTGMGDGGAESLVRDYALHLDNTKFRVIVVTLHPLLLDSGNCKILMKNNVLVIPIYAQNVVYDFWLKNKIWNRFFDKEFVVKRLMYIIKTYNVCIIHAHLRNLFYLKAAAKKLKGIRVFYTVHNEPKRILSSTKHTNPINEATYLYKHSNFRMIALHDIMRNEINTMFNVSNTVVLHNGIDFNRFNGTVEIDKGLFRETLGISKNSFVVGHIGRFAPAKNHSFLVDIFHGIVSKRPDAHLLLVGDGPLLQDTKGKLLAAGLEGKFTILSNRVDIPELLSIMDIFVFPSKWEGLPVTLVEAQRMNLRCVISDVVTKECFFSDKAVPLSLSDSPEKWADIILDERVKGPYVNDINEFDIREVYKKLEQLYS